MTEPESEAEAAEAEQLLYEMVNDANAWLRARLAQPDATRGAARGEP